MIVVHDGRAHADDFLAACVCGYRLGASVVRSKCDDKMLDDPNFWVLDQGRRFEPDLHNFDHHQLEEELCAFTMVLDHFYGPAYRESWPALRFTEILDSYGPKRAAAFAGVPEDSLETLYSPIHLSMISAFSRIEGEVPISFLEVMNFIGAEICAKIESEGALFASLDVGHRLLKTKSVTVLDVCGCIPPTGMSHEHLPTKQWCKVRRHSPEVILTKDPRQGGFRMVSINTDSLRFRPDPRAYFVHNSGFLVGFSNYEDHLSILEDAAAKMRADS